MEASKARELANKVKMEIILDNIIIAVKKGINYVIIEDLRLSRVQTKYLEDLGYTVAETLFTKRTRISW